MILLIIPSAGYMTWEIAHNIDTLLTKDEKNHARFDLTVDVNEEESGPDLSEFVRGMFSMMSF